MYVASLLIITASAAQTYRVG